MKAPIGRVYVLSNKAMPSLLKIGYTMNTVEGRVKELSIATGVPSAFTIEYQVECRNPAGVESSVHGSLAKKRVNISREFFSISVREAVEAIRLYADEIFDEEILSTELSSLQNGPSLENCRKERLLIKDWMEVWNPYWKIYLSKSFSSRTDDEVVVWQTYSVWQNAKMHEYQSVMSKRKYNIKNGVYSPIYDCYYSLPMHTGSIVREVFRSESKYFPIKGATPSESVIAVIKNWSL